MPCKYNTFDGRLLWFDGVEGKRGLTSTSFSFFAGGTGGGGEGVKLFHCIVRTGVYGIPCPAEGDDELMLNVLRCQLTY